MSSVAESQQATFSLATVPTPCLVLERDIVQRNIARLADYTAAHRLALRPHTKTHKSRTLAQLQLDAGAQGLTVAKLGEAEIMVGCTEDLLLAYPIVDAYRAEGVARLARRCRLKVAIDSGLSVQMLRDAAARADSQIGVLVDLDVGNGRTGVQDARTALQLAQQIERASGLQLEGIFCYPGQITAPAAQQPALLQKVADRLQETLDLWKRHGLAAPTVSGGSTPTAYQSHHLPQLTEIRPGTYVFNDMNTVHGGFCQLDDCAATVLCTVVSDAVPGQVVIDAGSKMFSSDRCGPAPDSGHGHVIGYPEAVIRKLNEEHGWVDVRSCPRAPALGERLRVVPNHICTCVNLQRQVWWLVDDSQLQAIPVDAQSCLW